MGSIGTGFSMSLDGYIADPKLTDVSWDPNDFFASFAKASSIEGKRIGVVINAETSLLAYRKDLFTKFNRKVPTTMKELEETANVKRDAKPGTPTPDAAGRTLFDAAAPPDFKPEEIAAASTGITYAPPVAVPRDEQAQVVRGIGNIFKPAKA